MDFTFQKQARNGVGENAHGALHRCGGRRGQQATDILGESGGECRPHIGTAQDTTYNATWVGPWGSGRSAMLGLRLLDGAVVVCKMSQVISAAVHNAVATGGPIPSAYRPAARMTVELMVTSDVPKQGTMTITPSGLLTVYASLNGGPFADSGNAGWPLQTLIWTL